MSNRTGTTGMRGMPDLIATGALVVDGVRLPLLSGEVQFFRMDPAAWETALRSLKDAGLPIVSTYLSWQRFSLGPDRCDLEGTTDPRLDVRRFLDLCVKLDLLVTMKPGPWICAEEANGGLPDWLVANEEIQVLDAAGRPVRGYNPPFQSPIPSYLHPVYLEHLRRWITRVDTVLSDYLHPRGPILLVQLDNEPSYTFHDGLLESDYNPVNVDRGGLYSQWLERKYERVDALNRSHGSAWATFAEAAAPRTAGGERARRSPGAHRLGRPSRRTCSRAISRPSDGCTSTTVSGTCSSRSTTTSAGSSLYRRTGAPWNWRAGWAASTTIRGSRWTRPALTEVAMHVGYSRVCNALPWSPEIQCGTWSYPGQVHAPGEIPPREYEYLYLACIAFGLKGMNFYMFADRDNWIDSPLDAAGRPSAGMAAVRRVLELIRGEPGFERMERQKRVAVLYYRPAAREAFVADAAGNTPAAMSGGVGSSYRLFVELFAELHAMNLDPAILDPWVDPSAIGDYRVVFSPRYEDMDEASLSALDDAAARGAALVWAGPRPQHDRQGMGSHPCIGARSVPDGGRHGAGRSVRGDRRAARGPDGQRRRSHRHAPSRRSRVALCHQHDRDLPRRDALLPRHRRRRARVAARAGPLDPPPLGPRGALLPSALSAGLGAHGGEVTVIVFFFRKPVFLTSGSRRRR